MKFHNTLHRAVCAWAMTFLCIGVMAQTPTLPPQAQADLLQIRARDAMAAGQFLEAVKHFEAAQSVSAARLSPLFHFQFAKALRGAEAFDKAEIAMTHYIRQAASEGSKEYVEALEFLAKLSDDKRRAAQARKEADEAMAERERARQAALDRYLEFGSEQWIKATERCFERLTVFDDVRNARSCSAAQEAWHNYKVGYRACVQNKFEGTRQREKLRKELSQYMSPNDFEPLYQQRHPNLNADLHVYIGGKYEYYNGASLQSDRKRLEDMFSRGGKASLWCDLK